MALLLLVLVSPLMLGIALWIKWDSKGPIFFRQERVTQYGRRFRIFKFRTMVVDAPQKGAAVTVKDDPRITRSGRFLRHYRLDELPQLLDILRGTMSFVGTRPESVKYVQAYSKEMFATLLLPAGVTCEASLCFKDEADLLDGAADVDEVYIHEILPKKMAYNLRGLKQFRLLKDFQMLFATVHGVLHEQDRLMDDELRVIEERLRHALREEK